MWEEKDINCFYKKGKYFRRQCKPCQEERRKTYINSEKGRETIMKYMNEYEEERKNTENKIKSILKK